VNSYTGLGLSTDQINNTKKLCIIGEEYVKNSLFLDIYRYRSRSEIDEELEIIRKTVEYFTK